MYFGTYLASRPLRPGDKVAERRLRAAICHAPAALYLADLEAGELTPVLCRAAARSLLSSGLAPATIRSIVGIWASRTRDAIADGLLQWDPWAALRPGDVPPARPLYPGENVFEVAELTALVAPRRPLERVLRWIGYVFTACRPSELLAARWSAWHRGRTKRPLPCLAIEASLHEDGAIGPTKTGSVQRVPILPAFGAWLGWLWSDGWRRLVGRSPTEHDLIWSRRDGTAACETVVCRQLYQDLRALGIPRGHRTLHGLRGSVLTALEEAGAQREVIDLIAHAPPSDVQGRYYHPRWRALCEAMQRHPVTLPPPSTAQLSFPF